MNESQKDDYNGIYWSASDFMIAEYLDYYTTCVYWHDRSSVHKLDRWLLIQQLQLLLVPQQPTGRTTYHHLIYKTKGWLSGHFNYWVKFRLDELPESIYTLFLLILCFCPCVLMDIMIMVII